MSTTGLGQYRLQFYGVVQNILGRELKKSEHDALRSIMRAYVSAKTEESSQKVKVAKDELNKVKTQLEIIKRKKQVYCPKCGKGTGKK